MYYLCPFIISVAISVQFDNYKFENDIEKLVTNLLECNEIPGLTLGVGDFKNGYYYSNGFGVADVKTKTPVDRGTLFNLASNSKLFTSLYAAWIR